MFLFDQIEFADYKGKAVFELEMLTERDKWFKAIAQSFAFAHAD